MSSVLPDLLSHLGYSVRRIGSYYTIREMDSLRIKDRRTWYRYSERLGGDAITFLQHFCGKSFPEAVEYLLSFHGRARDSPQAQRSRSPPAKKEKVPFVLPPAHTDQRRVFAYLRKRGIAPQVIQGFIDAGLLYEDTPHHNCVFVGRDNSGKPVFANKRGTYDLNGSGFKGDVPGSNKDIAFWLSCDPTSNQVLVFEAPIDLMSYCTMHWEVTSNAVALCGLYDGALETYLRENPHLRHIILCLDADEHGRDAAVDLTEKYSQRGYTVSIQEPVCGKDWNEQLCQKDSGTRQKEPEKKKEPENTHQGGHSPMANLGQIISDKTAADTQWREQRQAERENTAAMRDASIEQITTDPAAYARYLNIQGDNPAYGVGSVALVIAQYSDATIFGTRDRWKALGRSVLDTERDKGMKIFAKSPSGRGYMLTDVFDIEQTEGRELKQPRLLDDTREMEAALATLLNHATVPVTANAELPVAAQYDQQKMEISVNPSFSDSEAFAAIAAEIAHARFHDRGDNPYYSRTDQEIPAQSVSYLLCRRFGIERDPPDLSNFSSQYQNWNLKSRRQSLDGIQRMSRQIGNSIERNFAPPQRNGPSVHQPER